MKAVQVKPPHFEFWDIGTFDTESPRKRERQQYIFKIETLESPQNKVVKRRLKTSRLMDNWAGEPCWMTQAHGLSELRTFCGKAAKTFTFTKPSDLLAVLLPTLHSPEVKPKVRARMCKLIAAVHKIEGLPIPSELAVFGQMPFPEPWDFCLNESHGA